MEKYFEPVDVELSIENPTLERGAFYNLCFITENEVAPRTLEVTRLTDLLENGYSRLDLAYNFCVGVFAQQGISSVFVRAKREKETFIQAYNSDDNNKYYYVIIQSKNLEQVSIFREHLKNSQEDKLLFFSNVSSLEETEGMSGISVEYFQDYTYTGDLVSLDDRDYYLNKAYGAKDTLSKISLPDYLLEGLGRDAVEHGVTVMTGSSKIWEIDEVGRRVKYKDSLEEPWKYIPIFDVAIQVKRDSIEGVPASVIAVENSLPFTIPNYKSVVSVLGETLTGEVVVAEVSDKNRLPDVVGYKWYSNEELVGSEKSYQILNSDLGKTLKLVVTYTDLDGYLETTEVQSLVGKSTKRYWESGEYPKEILIGELEEGGYLESETFEVKAIPLNISIKEVLVKNKADDTFRVKATPLQISLVSIMKSRSVKDKFSVRAEPKDITLKNVMKDYFDEDSFKIKAKPLDITVKEVLVKNKADDTFRVKATPLDISKIKKEEVIQ